MSDYQPIRFELNGTDSEVWAWPNQTLLEVLRERAGAGEVKYGCGEGVCGTCTVLLDGETVNACLIFAPQVEGHRVTTLRGLEDNGELHGLQRAFLEHGGSQCGFCTPGMILAAYEFTEAHPGAAREDVRRALSGNLCRCTGYTKILDAVAAYVAEGGAATAEDADG